LLRLAAGALSRRRLLAVSAVALAIGSAALVEHARHRAGASAPPVISWVLFAVGAAALALAAGYPRRLPAAAVAPLRSVLQTPRRLAFVALAIAGLTSAASVPLFLRLNRFDPPRHPGWLINDGSWLLYVSSLLAFAIGIAAWGRSASLARTPAVGGEQLAPRLELPLVGTLVVLALALRLIHLDSIPPGLWFDEAQNGLAAQALYASGAPHVVFIPGFTQMGAPFFYVLGGLLQLAGPEVWALRLLPALAGAATVPLLYYLASRLYGWRVGAVAAALLAASAWNITFSRLGYASMWTVALDLAVYLCVVQGLRTGRLGWYAAGGVTLGLAQQGYYIAELLPLVLLAIVVHLAITERQTLRALRTGAAVLIAGAALAYLPAGLYAVQRPGDYEQRVSETTIFATTPGDKVDAVLTNARIHLLMFDFRGEENARHDLPGSPVLDWITAGLFFSGLGICLLRLGRWQFFFPIAWWLAALSAGIWTSVAGAPHSGRTLENSIVTSLLAGIFLGDAWRVWARGESRRRLWLAGAVIGVLGIVGVAAALNVHRYFDLQAKERLSWVDMYAGHVFAGRALDRYAATREVWVADLFYGPYGYSTVAYLAPRDRGRRWTGMERFPFTGGSRRDVVLALDPGAATDLASFAGAYPHARFRALVPTGSDQEPLAYAVFVPQRDLRASHGLALVGERGRARLVTSLKVPRYGRYRLAWQARRGPTPAVYVDGRGGGPQKTPPLAAGLHRVVVSPASPGRLVWARPGLPPAPVPPELLFDPRRIPVRGLLGVYRTGIGLSAPAKRVDRTITFDDPIDNTAVQHTVEWRGRLFAPVAGRYLFETLHVGTVRLDLDGKTVFATRAPTQPGGGRIDLSVGWHDVRLRYRASTGLVTIRLMWAPPGLPVSVIPSAFLYPPGATGPPSAAPRMSAADGSRLPPSRLDRTSDLTRAP
jgi:4-amino-4-deoxy-L-arabinose transferase-like glycosyltransferase